MGKGGDEDDDDDDNDDKDDGGGGGDDDDDDDNDDDDLDYRECGDGGLGYDESVEVVMMMMTITMK